MRWGCKRTPKNFELVKIRENPWKSKQNLLNLGQICENLRKIPENTGKYDAQRLQNHMQTFSWRSSKKLFRQVWRNSGKNPSHPQKFACSYTYEPIYKIIAG